MRKLMWFSVGFALASVISVYCNGLVSLPLVLVLGVLGISLFVATHWARFLRIPAMLLFSLALGLGWFLGYDSLYLQPARELDGCVEEMTIRISDYSDTSDYGTSTTGWITLDGKPYQILVYGESEEVFEPGQFLRGSFRFTFTAHGGSKAPSYRRSEGIFLTASPRGKYEIEGALPEWYDMPAVFRNTLTQRIGQLFPRDAAAFAKALLLGEREDISYEMSTTFKVSGISHIVAVSGLHVSILFGLVYLLTVRKRSLTFLLGLPVLFLFAAVTGFTPSVTRACIMQGLMLLAMLAEREYDPPTALGFAVLVMLIVNPMVVVSISFQLSVGCMIGIFLFSGKIRQRIVEKTKPTKEKNLRNKLKHWFATSVAISLGASVVTTPLVAYHFGTISLISVVTNLLVVWAIAYVFYGIMIACTVSIAGLWLGKLVALPVSLLIRFVLGISAALAKLPFAAVYTQSVYVIAWLFFVYAMLLVFLLIKKKQVLVFVCLCTISLCAALTASWLEPLTDECRVTVLDVGQGQCVLLQGNGKTFMVDCGGSWDSSAADIAAETLYSQGVRELDGLIITHYDLDHAGGVPYLLTRISADTIYLPDMKDSFGFEPMIRQKAGNACILVSDDLTLSFEEYKIQLFAPENYNLENECSVCVLFHSEKCDILITGDRGSLGESLLMNRAELPEVDLLVAGHHGSVYSTGEKLLDLVNPRYAVISVGENRYGHPAQEVLERLWIRNCAVWRTDYNGTIVFRR